MSCRVAADDQFVVITSRPRVRAEGWVGATNCWTMSVDLSLYTFLIWEILVLCYLCYCYSFDVFGRMDVSAQPTAEQYEWIMINNFLGEIRGTLNSWTLKSNESLLKKMLASTSKKIFEMFAKFRSWNVQIKVIEHFESFWWLFSNNTHVITGFTIIF